MKNSLKNRAFSYIKRETLNNDRWIPKSELEMRAKEAGFLADNIDRKLRELAAEGKIERQIINKTAHYRYQRSIDELVNMVRIVFG